MLKRLREQIEDWARRWGQWPRADRLTLGVLSLCALAVFVFVIAEYPPTPAIRADSGTYVRFAWYRAPGVGLVVNGLYAVAGTLQSVIVLQLACSLGAALFFAWTFGKAVESRAVSLTLGLWLVFHGSLRRMDITLLSESLFVSSMLVSVALCIRYWQRGSTVRLGAAAALIGVAMMMRPTGLAGLVPLVVCWLGREPRPLRSLALGIAPLVGILAVWSGVNYYRVARATPFLNGGQHLFAATVQYLTPDILELDDPTLTKHEPLIRKLVPATDAVRERLRASQRLSLGKQEGEKSETMFDVYYRRGAFPKVGKIVDKYFKARIATLCPPVMKRRGRPHLPSCMEHHIAAIGSVAWHHHPLAYAKRTWDSWVWYTKTTHDTKPGGNIGGEWRSLTGRAYRSSWTGSAAKEQKWWRRYGVKEIAPDLRKYPLLVEPPFFFSLWHDLMLLPVGKVAVGGLLGDLDRWVCLALLFFVPARTLVLSIRHRRLELPKGPTLILASSLYGLYAINHLMGAMVHPAVDRYTLTMEPFVLAGLLALIVGAKDAIAKLRTRTPQEQSTNDVLDASPS